MDARRVMERSEWSSIARFSPTFTHEWSWAHQCAERIRSHVFFKVDIEPVYMRVWVDATMFGCPFLVLGESRAMTVPRARPLALNGDSTLDPRLALEQAWPDASFYDDSHFEGDLVKRLARLQRRADADRRAWSLSDTDRQLILDSAEWSAPIYGDGWMRALARLWRGTWNTRLITHLRAGDPIGWHVEISRPDHGTEIVAVIEAGKPTHPWLPQRLPESGG